MEAEPELNAFDQKANAVFGGKVVRKDVVRKIKVGANVPIYVLEYLLSKYCAADDPQAVEAGLRLVNDTLADNFIRPDEAMKAQSRVKEQGQHRFIDTVTLVRTTRLLYPPWNRTDAPAQRLSFQLRPVSPIGLAGGDPSRV